MLANFMIEALLPVFGFLIAIVASMVGVGGGVFIVPLLTLAYDFSPPNAIGTSLATIVFTSFASTVNYSRQRRIYYRTGLILAVVTVPGAYLGAYLTSIVEPSLLGLAFGVFLTFVALRMILRFRPTQESRLDLKNPSNSVDSESSLLSSRNRIVLGTLLAFFGGLSSGLLGIGGGSLMVPVMVLVMGMAMHISVATSMFTMIFTSTSGVIQHSSLGNIDVGYALLLVVGTVFGAQVGAYTSRRISGKNLRRIFGLVLILVSARMILKYI